MRRTLILFAFVAACRSAAPAASPPENQIWLDPSLAKIGDRVIQVEPRELPQSVSVPGRVTFDDLHVTHVASPVTGRVSRVLALPGARVRAGAPLMAILSPDVGQAFADVVKAAADQLQAEAEFDRERRLATLQAATERDVEAAENAYRRATAEFTRANEKARLLSAGRVNEVTQEYTLYSPLTGEVVARNVNPGMEVVGQYSGGTAQELFTVGDIRRVWVFADVAEADLPRVEVGAVATVTVAAWPGRTFLGKVDWLSDVLDPQARTARARIPLDNADEALKPEMFAQVQIAAAPRKALALPRKALTMAARESFVFAAQGTLADGRRIFERRMVRTEQAGGDLVEVLSGLSAGDEVLVPSGPALASGVEEISIPPGPAAEAGVRSERVEARDVPDAVVVGGRLAFDDERVTHVFSPVTGRVTRVLAGPGEHVRRGAPLAAILSPDVGSAVADLAKAEADKSQAEHEFERQKELFAARAGARRDLEAAEDAFLKADAELQRARERTQLFRAGNVDRATQEFVLTSPIDGEVVARNINPGLEVQGQYSGASSPVELFTIGNTDPIWIFADVYEVDLPLVKKGQEVTVTVGAWPDRAFHGKIEWISDVLDPTLRAIRVRCAIENHQRLLKPEMYEEVSIKVPGRSVLAVPRQSIVRIGEGTSVFVDKGIGKDGGRIFERRSVVADEGRTTGLVPVWSGLKAGESVVTGGALFVLGAFTAG